MLHGHVGVPSHSCALESSAPTAQTISKSWTWSDQERGPQDMLEPVRCRCKQG